MKIYYEHPNYITETNNKYGNSSIFKHHGINLNLTHFQRKIEISTCIVNFIGLKKEQYLKQIIEYLQNNETIEEYFFQNVKKYFSNQDVFKEYLSDEIVFTYRDIEHAIINNLPIEKILIFWLKGYVNHEFISNRKEELLNSILQNLNTIKADKNLLKAYVKTLKNKLSDNNKQETNESDELKIQFIEIEKLILENLNVEQILYLWVYALIETFDFNSYCFYYFTLNTTERKIFNKKAKALMGEEIKKSMLKQREPWEFIEESEGVKIFKATWRSIWFANNFIRICVDKDARFSNSYYWNFSEEKFNFLFDYISGRRLKDLTIYVKDEIIKIDGLDDLEEIIWKIQFQREVESSNKLSGSRMTGSNRIPVNMILRNKCIQFLSKLQINGLEPTRVLEKTFFVDKGGSAIDISLLFSIPINNDKEVVIIWESLELEKSKATHIFKCNRNEYDDLFDNVENYLSTKAKVRSTLNSNNFEDVEKQKKLRYVCRIDHDNFHYEKWENQIFEILPELKNNIKN